MEFTDLDLAILPAYRLQYRWGAHLNLITTVKNENEKPKLFLSRMTDLARLPARTMAMTADKDMELFFGNAPIADMNIFPYLKNWMRICYENSGMPPDLLFVYP